MSLSKIATEKFSDLSLTCTGVHQAILPSQIKKGELSAICFDFETRNPKFFGQKYNNAIRTSLHSLVYERLYGNVACLGIKEFWLDSIVSLKKPYSYIKSPLEKTAIQSHGLVDITADSKLEISPLYKENDVELGSLLERYSKDYGVNAVLKDHGHHISPDPITIELINAICAAVPVQNLLELGAGLGTSGVAAQRNGIEDYLLLDINKKVVDFMKISHDGRAIFGDAFKHSLDRHFDLLSIGTQYELNPHLLEARGKEFARKCDYIIIQSGCATFYQFEHDWLMGRTNKWPWFSQEQTVGHYFQNVAEVMFGFQTAILASNNPLRPIMTELKSRGFTDFEYKSMNS